MTTRQKTLSRWLVALVCLGLAGSRAASEEKGAVVSEYQLKAAFIYNFTQFTDWPPAALVSTSAPLVIGILGEDPFGKMLDDVVLGEMVRGRPLAVKRLRTDEELPSCHALFISRSEKDRLPALFSQLKGSPVLTMSDVDGFAQQGGMVNLLLVNKTVKMEINQSAAQEAGLQISSKLLKLACIVKTPRG